MYCCNLLSSSFHHYQKALLSSYSQLTIFPQYVKLTCLVGGQGVDLAMFGELCGGSGRGSGGAWPALHFQKKTAAPEKPTKKHKKHKIHLEKTKKNRNFLALKFVLPDGLSGAKICASRWTFWCSILCFQMDFLVLEFVLPDGLSGAKICASRWTFWC